jgi:hypothetical protein
MPDQAKTPHSSFRIPPDVKAAAAAKAGAEGRDLTAVVVELLRGYVTQPPPPPATTR